MTDDAETLRAKLRAEIAADRDRARHELIARLKDEDEDRLAARLERCGETIGLTCTNCGAHRTARTRCDLKWCPSCAPLLAHKAAHRYDRLVTAMTSPLFVTFTAKNFKRRDKKGTGVRELRRAFTKLRRLRWWKRCVAGGVAAIELTNRGKGWHPHIHALIDARWLAVSVPCPPPGTPADQYKRRARKACEEVAEQWTLTLGRPASIKVRRIATNAASVEQACREVLKYSLKPDALKKVVGPIGPALHELSITRQRVTWGTCYHSPLLQEPDPKAVPCECCDALRSYIPDELIDRMLRNRR